MNLELQLSPDVDAKLRERAALTGRTPESFVLEAVQEKLSSPHEMDEAISPNLRLAEFEMWLESHPVSETPVLDDSRESSLASP